MTTIQRVWPNVPISSVRASGKPRLLIIGPTPPPYSGPEIGTEIFLQSDVLNERFALGHLNTTVRATNSEKGKRDATLLMAYVGYLAKLARALIQFRPDAIVYRPTTATRVGWVRDGTTLLASRLMGVKVILQFGGGHFRYFYNSLGFVGSAIIRRLLGMASLILAESRSLGRQFSGLVATGRISDLPTAIQEDFFAHFEHCRRAERTGPVRVLFVGHLSQAKGFCDVLKVIPALANQFDVVFQFIGAWQQVERNIFFNQLTGERIPAADSEAVFAEVITGNRLGSAVEFLGDKVFGDAKLEAFESADIFVLPSYSEGFSRAMLEALAAGLPVIVSRVGAVPDILDDGVNGFIVAPGDLAALADRLAALLKDAGARERMGRAGRDLCRSRFRAEIVSGRLAEIVRGFDNPARTAETES